MPTVTEAVLHRRSTRAFEQRPVHDSLLREMIEIARYSPSSGNLQPWKLVVLSGDALELLKQEVGNTLARHPRGEGMGYPIYPSELQAKYQMRRSQCAEDLYATLGVTRDDREGRNRQFARNFRFFDAPVGMILVIDKSMGAGQWADLGMFLQTLMLLAHERGLATCAQACWTLVHRTVERQLALPNDMMVFCGIALGYPDLAHPINTLRTSRESVAGIAEFRGFVTAGAV